MPRQYTRTPIETRLWAKVDRRDPDECWPCGGRHTIGGYGKIREGGAGSPTLLAHRVSWMIHFGPIPEGLLVLHNCPGGDNPACVNPAHLWLGTHSDNNRDTQAKGRSAKGERNGKYTKPERTARGERHGGAKLTEGDVREIRRRYASGESQTAIARSYGMSTTTISDIVRDKLWKHVT